MKILIVCVNYNSYDELRNYLQSVEKSASNVHGDLQVDVIIADNSSTREIVDCNCYVSINVKQVELPNLGYLGGAQAIINDKEDILLYKYVIISNVDLIFKRDTLVNIEQFEIGKDIAWVAPDIFSEKYQKRLNPNVVRRYKVWKLRLLKLTYHRSLYKLYDKYYYSKKKELNLTSQNNEMDIYAGHGACIILTENFFRCYQQIHYPIFLYGEELFFAELIKKKRLRVRYVPSIRMITEGGVSTSKMPSDSFFRYNVDAINYILKNFY